MDETMKNEVEVTTEVSGAEEVTQEIAIEDSSSGPSKGFIALVVGGIAAVAVGATVAIKRHKKKKAAAMVEEDEFENSDSDESSDFSVYTQNEEESKAVEFEEKK